MPNSVALLDGTLARGTLLIGFERVHRIGRFEIRDREVRAPRGYLRLPPEAKRMQPNQGIEAPGRSPGWSAARLGGGIR